jgi:hypothetical protein
MQSTDCCSVYPLALKGLGLKLESSPSLKSTEPQSALVSRSHANSGPVRSRQVVSWLLSTVYLRAPYCVLFMATPGRASPTLLEPGIRSAKDIYVMTFSLPALGRSWVQLLPKGMKSKRPVQGSFDISLESKSDGSRGDDSAPNHLSPAQPDGQCVRRNLEKWVLLMILFPIQPIQPPAASMFQTCVA